jgi:hypothetical protein
MLTSSNRRLAEELERLMKRYEQLLERQYNVGDMLTADEIRWMHDFNDPDRHIHGIYYRLRKVNDAYVDMILSRFESLKRKEHGLKQIKKIREEGSYRGAEQVKITAEGHEEFFNARHRDIDRLVNELILAVHKKSGGVSPTVMERYINQIRKKVDKIREIDSNAVINLRAAVNKKNNSIEIVVNSAGEVKK